MKNLTLGLMVGILLMVQVVYAENNPAFYTNETVVYDIKKIGVKAGEATITFKGAVNYEGNQLILIQFKANALNFSDEEKIFLKPDTMLPYIVERNLDLWGKKEKIREEYFHKSGEVKIIKDANGRKTEEILKTHYLTDNIYAFIYRYRMGGAFKVGEKLRMNLPTKVVNLSLLEKTTLKAAGKDYDAFFMQSQPKQFHIWFDTSASKIPLRIDGALGMGKTAMIMRSYTPASAQAK